MRHRDSDTPGGGRLAAPRPLPPGVVHISEALEEVVEELAQGPRRTWGPWRFDAAGLLLVHRETDYAIELERCATSAQVLDWIVQISEKSWADADTIASLVFAFDALLGLQHNLCGFGVERGPLDVRARLGRPT